MSSKKPNILFLMSDEHRADITGYEGDTVVRTPTLDALAKESVMFSNCYTPSPICVPARQAMMSGKSCKHCGCRQYGDDLAPFTNTFAKWLARYGYQTVCCGKLHHDGPDQMQGWTKRIGGDISITPKYREMDPSVVPYKAENGKWSDEKEVMRAGSSTRKTNDDYTIAGALQFIEDYFVAPDYDRHTADQPLLLKVSLVKPHYPYFTKPDLFAHYLPRVKARVDEPLFDHPFLSTRAVKTTGDLRPRDITRATAAYYGMIEELDAQYALVLNALEAAGQNLDDWLIIYTSDHGEMLGEHGIWEKQKFFEASARVPLLIRAPKNGDTADVAPHTVTKNVNTCDLYATLCAFAGVPVPEDLDSRNLLPLVQDGESEWDDFTVSHFGLPNGVNNLMLKKGALKYQYYGPAMPEVLFDLAANPAETINFAEDPAYAEAMAEFRAMAPKYQYEVPEE